MGSAIAGFPKREVKEISILCQDGTCKSLKQLSSFLEWQLAMKELHFAFWDPDETLAHDPFRRKLWMAP